MGSRPATIALASGRSLGAEVADQELAVVNRADARHTWLIPAPRATPESLANGAAGNGKELMLLREDGGSVVAWAAITTRPH
jgi:hypothetical protein